MSFKAVHTPRSLFYKRTTNVKRKSKNTVASKISFWSSLTYLSGTRIIYVSNHLNHVLLHVLMF